MMVRAALMQTVTFGEESLAAPNDTGENRQLNRRAEIVIVIQ
jgi:outer membrane protein OmpA-like peptidoglycan-associated protein